MLFYMIVARIFYGIFDKGSQERPSAIKVGSHL